MTARDYRTPTDDDDADVPYWLGVLAEDVGADVSGLADAVAGMDERLPEPVGGEIAFAVTDEDGRRSWLEVARDGGPTDHALALLAAAGLGTGAGTVTEAALTPDLAARIPAPFTLDDAKRSGARGLSVRDSSGTLRPQTSNPNLISFWGDSLLEGFPKPPFAASQADSLPGRFAALVPGRNVHNGGRSGQSADEIAVRQGGLVPVLTVAGGTIPATGAVPVTASGVLGWRLDRGIAGTTGTLAGVPGTLTRSGSALTFTRSAPGDTVPVPGPVPWESYGRDYASGVQVILAGRNDIGYTSPAGDVVSRVVSATQAMIESLTPQHPRVLLLGTITATGEGRGSGNYAQVTAINDTLRRLYPQYFWDFRSWLVNDALSALGITPTADDKAKMAADTLPPSLMTDSVHYSPATAQAAAVRIHAELTNRGWL